MQTTDLEDYLPDQLFRKVDMMSMQHTLEARAPFVDPDLLLWVLELPRKYKVKFNQGKIILKKLAEKFLPEDLVWRKKHGFTLPLDEWFRHQLSGLAKNSVKELSEVSGYLDWRYYGELVNKHISGDGNYGDRIFSIIVLTSWAKKNKIRL
jgi:asparagine synthase (glutamine-hydrolysing)